MSRIVTSLTVGLLLWAAPALAQPDHSSHGSHKDPVKAGRASTSPVAEAFRAANARMHRDMDVTLTGNADIDFVRSMIPHHQGAVDMARIELAHGKNPEIRKLAEDIIRSQEAEIALMKEWLARNGGQ